MNHDHFLSMIAKMHYIDKVKQKDIAARFDIMPMAVSRYLREAEQKGIVVFHVKMPWPLDVDLGNAVMKRYGLRECFVLDVPRGGDTPSSLGAFLADYFVQILPDNAVVGLSWGFTISKFVEVLPYVHTKNCDLIQLTGAFTSTHKAMTPTQIINEVSKKLDGSIFVINAPLYAGSKEMRDQLVHDPTIQQILRMAEKSDINIVGLSSMSREATTFQSEVISAEDYEELLAAGAIGDLAGTFLDKNGDPIRWSKSGMYTGVPLSKISAAKHTICIAGELHKAPVLRIVCKKKYFNTLITTQQVAKTLLDD